MVRAVGCGNRWRPERAAVACVLLTLAACTSSGGTGKIFNLPAGEEFDTTPGPNVIVVTEAQNQCGGSHGDCVPDLSRPCHTGSGNTRGLSVYRLGANGLLFSAPDNPAPGAVPEQVIATDDNPRRVIAHPLDPTLLYVATDERIQVFRLAADGTRCIGETVSPTELNPNADNLDSVDLVIDPTIGNGILYAAERQYNRIDVYPIAPDGTLTEFPTSCAVGRNDARYEHVTPLRNEFIAAGGRNNIDVFAVDDGQIAPPPATPTTTTTPHPDATPTATPSPAEPTPSLVATPSPRATCLGATDATDRVSSISAAIVMDMFLSPSLQAPLGQLFTAEQVSRRIFTFPVDSFGQINDKESSQTKQVGTYQTLLRRERAGSSVLFASLFDKGRVDVFRLENGLLPNQSFSRTSEDANALPAGIATEGEAGNILYVAQGGLGRIDGFQIAPDGSLADEPATSTAPVVDTSGATFNTFPDSLVIVPLP